MNDTQSTSLVTGNVYSVTWRQTETQSGQLGPRTTMIDLLTDDGGLEAVQSSQPTREQGKPSWNLTAARQRMESMTIRISDSIRDTLVAPREPVIARLYSLVWKADAAHGHHERRHRVLSTSVPDAVAVTQPVYARGANLNYTCIAANLLLAALQINVHDVRSNGFARADGSPY